MNRLLLAVLLTLAACTKESPPAAAPAVPARPPPVARPAPTEPSQPYALDADKLERYLQYQRAATRASVDALKRIGSVGPDAGTLTALTAVGGSLNDQKEGIDSARKASGLSEEEIRAIAPMVGDLSSRFVVATSFDQTSLIKSMEEQVAHAPPQAKAQMEKTVADMKASLEKQQSLAEERKKYGDANVDLLLSKKEDLIKAYKESLGVLGGGAQTAAPH
jgi:hypothetical protein